MSVRPPTVAGVSGGVATTTLAVALRGRDAGRTLQGADILACRGRLDSLRRAAAVLDQAGPGPRPVLAVTLDGARAPRGPIRAHLDQLAAVASAVVLLPDVGRWRSAVDPLPEVATLLVAPAQRLPRPLRAYAAALGALAVAVTASGRLAAAAQTGRTPAAPLFAGAASPRVPAVTRSSPGVGRPARPTPDQPNPLGPSAPPPAPAPPATVSPATVSPATGRAADAAAESERPPRVVGTFQPLIGAVTGAGPGQRRGSHASSGSAGQAFGLSPAAPTGAPAPAAVAEPDHPRGVRIVSPARSPSAMPRHVRAADGRSRGDLPIPDVERVEQVG